MKKVLIIILLILSYTNSEAQWRRLISESTFDMWANPKNYATMIAGGQGRKLYKTYDYGKTWDTIVIGYLGGAARFNNVFINPVDTNIYVIGGLLFGDIRVTTDGGKTWKIALQKDRPIALNGKSMVMKPDDPNVMYLGDWTTGVMYKSTNKGLDWDSISICTYKTKIAGVDTTVGVALGCLSIRTDSTNILILGTTSGEAYISTDHGVTWKFVQALKKPKLDLQDCEITRIDFSERDPRVGYGVITYLFDRNTPSGGVHKTTDGGYTWENIAYPDTSFWAVAVRTNAKGDDDEVFIGGYTENFFVPDSSRIVGIGLVRRSTDGGKTWYSYDHNIDWSVDYPANNSIYGFYFFNSDSGFHVGQNGYIRHTEDKGYSWDHSISNAKENLFDITFINKYIGFAVGDGGVILKSTNAGLNWNFNYTKELIDLKSISYNTKKDLYIVGKNGYLSHSTNQGQSWNVINTETKQNFNKILFSDKYSLVLGDKNTLLFSEDDGKQWTKLNSTLFDDEDFVSGEFSKKYNKFYFLSNKNKVYTIDFQKNIELLKKIEAPRKLNSLSTLNDLIYLVGDSGLIIRSLNNLKDLEFQTASVRQHFYAVKALDDTLGILGGRYRTIMRTLTSGKIWNINSYGGGPVANMWSMRYFGPKGEEKIYLASEAGLFVLDYPAFIKEIEEKSKDNPLIAYPINQELLSLKFNSSYIGNLTIRILNIRGQLVKEIITNKKSNIYEDKIDISSHPNGAYILQVISNNDGYSLIYLK